MDRPRGRLTLLAVGAAIAAYAFFIAWYHAPYAGGSDSSGYLNSARLLLAGRLTAPSMLPPELPPDLLPRSLLAPLGYTADPKGTDLLPSYPVGLPLHFAAAGCLIGLGPAATLVAVLAALGLVGLLYLTARELGVRPGWAAGLAAAAGLSPLTLFYALQPMSDLVTATWTVLTMFCALRSARHRSWALAAGAAFAVSVLMRPTNLLLVLPALVALAPDRRAWLAFAVGGVPGALFLAGYNHALYGRYLTTGYGDVSSLFAFKNVLITLNHYALWIPVVASPLVLAAVALPFLHVSRRTKALLILWGGILPAFYAFYACTHEHWWYLRFILPSLPAAGLAAVLVLQEVRFPSVLFAARLMPAGAAPASPGPGRTLQLPLTLVLVLATVGWMTSWNRELRIRYTELDERAYRLAGEWAAQNLRPGDLVVGCQTSGALLYYAGVASLNFNELTPEQSARFLAWLDREARPIHAVLYPFEVDLVRAALPGRWELVTELRQASVWRRTGPAP